MRHTIKIPYDKWYTPIDTSNLLITKTIELIGEDNISEIIEPSAGNGSFSNILFKNYKNVLAYDLMPEEDRIIKQDFMELPLEYKKNRLFIGNPPFGLSGKLAKKFILKSLKNADYVGYILPTSYYNCDYYWIDDHNFKCIYKEVINDFGKGIDSSYMLWKSIGNNKIKDFIDKYNIQAINNVAIRSIRKSYDIKLLQNNTICIQMGNNYLTNNYLTKKGDILSTAFVVINTNSKELDKYINEILSNRYLRELAGVKLHSCTKITLFNLLFKACEGKDFKVDDIIGIDYQKEIPL